MWNKFGALAFLAAASVHGDTPAPRATARQAEIERLDNLAKDEKDPNEQRKLWQQSWELRHEQYREDIPRLHAEWQKETDPEKKRRIGEELVDDAIQTDQPQFLIAVATDGKFPDKEIKVSEKTPRDVPLHVLKSFEPEPYPYEEQAPWVIRRMTEHRFELWLPRHGWLFGAKGNLLVEAHPPRRDGVGRQWYGAFVPDGRWVTTDLWDYDRTLHFFSRNGKWRKDISADTIVPRGSDDDRWNSSIIGWCRCDKEGRNFVLSVGTNGGRGDAWVSADGKECRRLTENDSPWKMCYRRDLEPKGMYTARSIPNDRGDQLLGYTVPGHGAECAYPTFRWSEVSVQVMGPGAFGFWPGSSNVYIETADIKPSAVAEADAANEDLTGPAITLFYNFDGTFTGWIPATRLTDATPRDGMLFQDAQNCIVRVSPDLRAKEKVRFVSEGATAQAEKLFPDLRLGFFKSGHKLVLARW